MGLLITDVPKNLLNERNLLMKHVLVIYQVKNVRLLSVWLCSL